MYLILFLVIIIFLLHINEKNILDDKLIEPEQINTKLLYSYIN